MLSFLKTNFKITAVFIAAFLCFAFFIKEVQAKKTVIARGRITAHKLNVRKRPSRTSPVLIVLKRGIVVDVYEKKGGIGGWLLVGYKNKRGYIRNRSQYVSLFAVKKKIVKKKVAVKKKTVKKKAAAKKKEPVIPKKPVEDKKVIEKAVTVKKEVIDKADSEVTQEKKAEEKKKIEAQIKKVQKNVESFSNKEIKIIEGLNEIDKALNKARVSARSLSKDVKQLNKRIEKIKRERKDLSLKIARARNYAGGRLNALYRMNMIGRLEVVGEPGSVFDFFLKQNAMKRIIESDFQVIEKQNQDMKQLAALGEELEAKRLAKIDLESELTLQIRIKEKESKKKETILKEIREQKKLSLAAYESLKKAAEKLELKIIHQISKNAIQEQEGKAFSSFNGKLLIPVKGRIISKYGPKKAGDYKSYTFQSGIDIKTERGEPGKTIFKGEVLFAEWLNGYGNLMIINHGENYYSLYAHLEEIFKQKGDTVQTGEVIATAGDSGSIKGLCLHFELRHHGKPVNTLNLIKKGA